MVGGPGGIILDKLSFIDERARRAIQSTLQGLDLRDAKQEIFRH